MHCTVAVDSLSWLQALTSPRGCCNQLLRTSMYLTNNQPERSIFFCAGRFQAARLYTIDFTTA